MIPGEYIKTFIPIQELDELKPQNGIAQIKPDDLFLMSQISAYTNRESSSVAVSKKINYKNLSQKISSDFSIGDIKLSVQNNRQLINNLSNELRTASVALSTQIELSAQSLSTYIDNNILELSAAISGDNGYIQKYGEQTCSLIDNINDPSSPAEFATNITLSDGQIIQIDKTSLSDLMAPKHWKISLGGIAVDNTAYHAETTLTVEQNTIECEISNDCYVNCMISAAEYDRSSPIQVWLSSVVDDQSSLSSLYCTLNNSGGFSGNQYFSNYHFSIPVKRLSGAKIILKREDESTPFYSGTKVVWDFYCYFAMTSRDDLSGYVKKSGSQLQPYSTQEVCKLKFNSDGLITGATKVYYGLATSSDAGLVKINPSTFTDPDFGLSVNSNGIAYTHVAQATNNSYGTVKLNYAASDISTNHQHAYGNAQYLSGYKMFLSCGLETNSDGKGQIFMPCASDSQFGVIKTKQDEVTYTKTVMSSYVSIDSNGHAYVSVPYAHYNQNDEAVPGIIKTGQPDTTEIRIVRNVYLDNQGYACVNVVNQMGIGPFIDTEHATSGYTMCIDVPLMNGQSSDLQKVKEFNGIEEQCSAYGSYLFKTTAEVNGWFMAEVIYEGVGQPTKSGSLQIICDGIAVTTLNPAYIQGANGKKFMHSVQLGVFKGGSENGSQRTFGAISDVQSFGHNDKLHFLIKQMSNQ